MIGRGCEWAYFVGGYVAWEESLGSGKGTRVDVGVGKDLQNLGGLQKLMVSLSPGNLNLSPFKSNHHDHQL
jgi:hypothetical protein